MWMHLYDGLETEIPEEIENYWNSLLDINKAKLGITNIQYKDNTYKAQINSKKVTVEIKYGK